MKAKLPTRAEVEAYFADWIPTTANRNALPKPLRSYIQELQTICDPAGTVRENVILKHENRALQIALARLKRLPKSITEGPRRSPLRQAPPRCAFRGGNHSPAVAVSPALCRTSWIFLPRFAIAT
jgi:hypothetical protein